jgi:hypothetical protein
MGDMGMTAHAMKLQAAEDNLKQLMVDVTRAMKKAQEAVARVTGDGPVATAETQPTSSSR